MSANHIGPINRAISAAGVRLGIGTLSKLLHKLAFWLALVGFIALIIRDPLGLLGLLACIIVMQVAIS